ncbi:MAG: hypothetical protein EP299_06470 [Acidobacteria bacterium]|nr:MAG: hypothetical protein EP299_06470 [Acidobacteriota bacterium]
MSALEQITGVETEEVERHVRTQLFDDPAAHRLQGLGVVVLAGYQKVDDFGVDKLFLQSHECRQHRLQITVHFLAIELLGEPLEIDTGGVERFADVIERYPVDKARRVHQMEQRPTSAEAGDI